MREQIVELNDHDDYHSARDRMSSAAADRVLLVWPPHQPLHDTPVLGRKLDLVLLHRHASRLRAHIAVVAQADTIADNAAELGIPVFDSVKDSHLFLWNSRRSPQPYLRPKVRQLPDLQDARRHLGRPRSFWYQVPVWRHVFGSLFAVPALVVVGMMLALTMPRAQVNLNPAVQHITAQLEMIADPDLAESNFSTRRIPAEQVAVNVNISGDTITTGSVDLATQHAQGTVVFTNLTNQSLQLPAGTAIRTTGSIPVRFVTQQDVNLEDRTATAEAPVRAFKPGPDGNVGTGLINEVEGPLGTSVAVTNQGPTTGGDVLRLPAVSRTDRNRLYDRVHEQIRQQGHTQIAASLEPHKFSPISTARVADVTSANFSTFVGEQTGLLTLEMRAIVAATVVDENKAYEIGRQELDIRAGTQLSLLEDSISLSRSTNARGTTGHQVAFTLTARGTAAPVIDPLAVQEAIRWRRASQASEILYAQFPVVTRPTITVWPSWFAFMPWLSWRTQVNVDTDTNLTGTKSDDPSG